MASNENQDIDPKTSLPAQVVSIYGEKLYDVRLAGTQIIQRVRRDQIYPKGLDHSKEDQGLQELSVGARPATRYTRANPACPRE